MNCPKCDEPMEPDDRVFWLPVHVPGNIPPISNSLGLSVRAYRCEDCEYVILKLA